MDINIIEERKNKKFSSVEMCGRSVYFHMTYEKLKLSEFENFFFGTMIRKPSFNVFIMDEYDEDMYSCICDVINNLCDNDGKNYDIIELNESKINNLLLHYYRYKNGGIILDSTVYPELDKNPVINCDPSPEFVNFRMKYLLYRAVVFFLYRNEALGFCITTEDKIPTNVLYWAESIIRVKKKDSSDIFIDFTFMREKSSSGWSPIEKEVVIKYNKKEPDESH